MGNSRFNDYKLSEDIVRALTSLNYEHPTEVQSKVIPVALEKERSCREITNGKWKNGIFWNTDL